MDAERVQRAMDAFDAANAEDPHGKELPYAQRMTKWLGRLAPDASEPLQLAARSQHIRRWMVPRNTFPMDRTGYLAWRKSLYTFHAEQAGAILKEIGYDEATIERVQSLLKKQKLKADPEMQMLEDVICLVFLEHYFSEFAADKDEAKMIGIIRRTWVKMSSKGHDAALSLHFQPQDLELIKKALNL